MLRFRLSGLHIELGFTTSSMSFNVGLETSLFCSIISFWICCWDWYWARVWCIMTESICIMMSWSPSGRGIVAEQKFPVWVEHSPNISRCLDPEGSHFSSFELRLGRLLWHLDLLLRCPETLWCCSYLLLYVQLVLTVLWSLTRGGNLDLQAPSVPPHIRYEKTFLLMQSSPL